MMYAKEIQMATQAGLVLTELHGEWGWIGTRQQFNEYQRLLDWVDEYGTYYKTKS
jgi:hypothetical protein